MALQARRLDDRPVIASLGWHLGTARHMEAAESGYDQAVEDDLLARSGWEEDGYRLFGISTLGGSSAEGWFLPIAESSALFLPAALWRRAGRPRRGVRPPGRRPREPRPLPPAVRARRHAAGDAARRGDLPPVPRGRGHVGTPRLGRDATTTTSGPGRPLPEAGRAVPLRRHDAARRARPPRSIRRGRSAPSWSSIGPPSLVAPPRPSAPAQRTRLRKPSALKRQPVPLDLEVGHEVRVVAA